MTRIPLRVWFCILAAWLVLHICAAEWGVNMICICQQLGCGKKNNV